MPKVTAISSPGGARSSPTMDLDELHTLVCDTASLTTEVWRQLGCDPHGDDPDALDRSEIIVLQTLIRDIDHRMAKAIEGLDAMLNQSKQAST